MREELGFWVSVAIVAVIGVAFFKLLGASKLGEAVPAIRQLAAFL